MFSLQQAAFKLSGEFPCSPEILVIFSSLFQLFGIGDRVYLSEDSLPPLVEHVMFLK
jgi:hypothetical protein